MLSISFGIFASWFISVLITLFSPVWQLSLESTTFSNWNSASFFELISSFWTSGLFILVSTISSGLMSSFSFIILSKLIFWSSDDSLLIFSKSNFKSIRVLLIKSLYLSSLPAFGFESALISFGIVFLSLSSKTKMSSKLTISLLLNSLLSIASLISWLPLFVVTSGALSFLKISLFFY